MIRPYAESDHDAVVALWELVFPEDPPWNEPSELIRRKLSVQRELFLVYVADGSIVGTVLAGFDGVRGWVHKLAVHPRFRRRGVAGELMRHAEDALLALGCTKLNLQVRSSNARVVDFYQRAGYDVEDRVSMSKHLGPSPDR